MTVRLDKDRWPGRSQDRRDKQPTTRDVTELHRYIPAMREGESVVIGLEATSAIELAYMILQREGVVLHVTPEQRQRQEPGYTVSGEPND